MKSKVISWFLKRKLCCIAYLKKFKKLGFKKLLPLSYFFLLLVGVLLTLVYSFVHSLVFCSSIFGTQFCTPVGIFVVLCASLPGYLISGNILTFIGELPWALSFAIVILTSVIFYYLLGLFIDQLKSRKLNAENVSKVIVLIFFAMLLFLAISLL